MRRFAPSKESAAAAPAAPGDEWLVFRGFTTEGREVYDVWRVPHTPGGMGWVTALIQAGAAIGSTLLGRAGAGGSQERQMGATYEQEAKAAADAYTAVQRDAAAGLLSEAQAAAALARIDARLSEAATALASEYTARKHAEYVPMFDSRRPVILRQARESYRAAGGGSEVSQTAAGLPSWVLPAAVVGAVLLMRR